MATDISAIRMLIKNFGICGVLEKIGTATKPLYHVCGRPSVPSILKHGLRGRSVEKDPWFGGKGPVIWLQRDLTWAKCLVSLGHTPRENNARAILPDHLRTQLNSFMAEYTGTALLEVDVAGSELYTDPHSPSLQAYETYCLIFKDVIPPERIKVVELEGFGAAEVTEMLQAIRGQE